MTNGPTGTLSVWRSPPGRTTKRLCAAVASPPCCGVSKRHVTVSPRGTRMSFGFHVVKPPASEANTVVTSRLLTVNVSVLTAPTFPLLSVARYWTTRSPASAIVRSTTKGEALPVLSRLVHSPLTPIRYSSGATTVLSGALPLIVADVAEAVGRSGVKGTWSNAAVRFHGAFCWPPAYGPVV